MKRYEQERNLISRRYKEYLSQSYHKENRKPGYFRKQDAWDCGRVQCYLCSGEKLLKVKKRQEIIAIISEQEQLREWNIPEEDETWINL